MDYVAHRPFLPLLLFLCSFDCIIGGLVIVLVAYGDLICQLPQSVGLGVYGTKTIFFTVFCTGGMEGLFQQCKQQIG